MSAVLEQVGGAAAAKILSRTADYLFTALDMGMERKDIIDQIHALEDAGMTPEDALKKLTDDRKAAHQALGEELGKPE